MSAIAIRTGQAFKFPDDPYTHIFKEIRFDDGDPIIIYEDHDGVLRSRRGFYLFDLITL